ncbi:hypothetical protein OA92_02945 [Marinomonas sp. SBI22]|uniref:hypothetical protein n=1 Tax=unclassified Marinomonas TaxID=196814 RepID=UPI0007AEE84D|nr:MULTISPECIES: hypothetical protein [unclassified Marinomonas]KZM38900.1 hypothetical protein OA91_23215 [Marinomonas sp. SBI8L]KZM44844.1 hypothetical protein OA92_02945 [Marinomonas sp. SBI22]
MKLVQKIFIFLFLTSSLANADNFPESYFEKELKKINQTVSIDLKDIKPGEILEVNALGRVVLIYRRTAKDLNYLFNNYGGDVVDPLNKNWKKAVNFRPSTLDSVWNKVLSDTQEQYELKQDRSLLRDYMIVLGHSPFSSCAIYTRPKPTHKHAVFYDICKRTEYDASGRVLKNTGYSELDTFNLHIPPYKVIDYTKIELGLKTASKHDQSEQNDKIDYSGLTPQEKLWLAAQNNDFEIIKKSIQQGANPSKIEYRGNALDYAITGSSYEVVTYLLGKGAKQTPVTKDMIEIVGRYEIYQLLKLPKNN